MSSGDEPKGQRPSLDPAILFSHRDRIEALNELLVEVGSQARNYRENLEAARIELHRVSKELDRVSKELEDIRRDVCWIVLRKIKASRTFTTIETLHRGFSGFIRRIYKKYLMAILRR